MHPMLQRTEVAIGKDAERPTGSDEQSVFGDIDRLPDPRLDLALKAGAGRPDWLCSAASA